MSKGCYNAEHIDVEKMEGALDNFRRYQQETQRTTIEKANAYYAGYDKALEDVRSMLHCSNYESEVKKTQAYKEGADFAFYEICKELDISCQDIREMKTSIDKKAYMIAKRIIERYSCDPVGVKPPME